MTENKNTSSLQNEVKKDTPEEKVSKPTKKRTKSIWIKDIVLAILNVGFVIGLIYLLNRLPTRANEVKSLRSNAQLVNTAGENTEILQFELDLTAEDYEKLQDLYPDEERLLSFVDEIENLRTNGTVVGFTFASKDPVVDKTKNLGLPIIIDMEGSWEAISQDIQTIQALPFLFRPVTFDAEEDREDNVVKLKYGGFLYVDESFEEN